MSNITIGLVVCIGGLGAGFAHQSKRITELESQLVRIKPIESTREEVVSPTPGRTQAAVRVTGTSKGAEQLLRKRLTLVESRLRWVVQRLEKEGPRGVDYGEDALHGEPEIEIAELQSNVDALLAAEVMKSPEALGRLREVIREEQTTARTQRWEERSERRKEIENDELRLMSVAADFSDRQLEEIVGWIDGERDTVRVYYQAAHRGESSFSQARDQARQQREATDQRVREVLDDTQFESYSNWRSERRGRH